MQFRLLSGALFLWLACPTWAAKWDVVPSLTLVQTYTDNLRLSSDETKESDWVTQVIPGISIAATAERWRFFALYSPQLTYYARNEDENQVYQRLYANGSAELVAKRLFFDIGANVDQYNISLQGPIAAGNTNLTDNRTTTTTAYASPFLVQDFGAAIRGEARYTYSLVNYSEASMDSSDSVGHRTELRLRNGPTYKRFTWDVSYDREDIRYGDSQFDWTSNVSLANARLLITPFVGLLANVGYEEYSRTIGRGSEGWLWSAGFDWAPTPRTNLVATYGRRFSGETYLFDFRHRTRLTAWGAAYSQSITTTRSEFFLPATSSTAGYLDTLFQARFPDPVARQKAIENFMAGTGLPSSLNTPVNVVVNQLFLQKLAVATAGFLGVRNLVLFNVFRVVREGIVGNVILPNTPDSSIQNGTSLAWNWRMSPRTAWNLGAAYGRNEIPFTGETYNYGYYSIGLTRQFQPRILGSLEYRRQQRDSDVDQSDFTENGVIATLRMTF